MPGQSDHQHGPTSRSRDVDADRAHRAALDREDDLVQQLVVAKYALSIGRDDDAMEALNSALAIARRSLTELLPTMESVTAPTVPARSLGANAYAGRMVRESPATTPATTELPSVDIPDRRRGLARALPALPHENRS